MRIGNLVTFCVSNFADACNCANTCIYKQAYFAVHDLTVKATKIGPLENFLPYDIHWLPNLRNHNYGSKQTESMLKLLFIAHVNNSIFIIDYLVEEDLGFFEIL